MGGNKRRERRSDSLNLKRPSDILLLPLFIVLLLLCERTERVGWLGCLQAIELTAFSLTTSDQYVPVSCGEEQSKQRRRRRGSRAAADDEFVDANKAAAMRDAYDSSKH